MTTTALQDLPSTVGTATLGWSWKVVITDINPPVEVETSPGGSYHTLYRTYATPTGSSQTTKKRLDWACAQASGASTASAVADGIWNALGSAQ